MRRLLSILMLTLCSAACADQGAPDGAGAPGADVAAQETATSIVQKHIAASGGRDRLLSARTMKFSARAEQAGDVDSFTVYRARPNMFRKEAKKGEEIKVKAFDGKVGWMKDGSGAASSVPEDKLAMMRQYAEFDDPILDYDKKGHKVELLGTEDVKGAPAYKLRLTLANGDVEDRYLDKKSLLEVKRAGEKQHDGKTERWATYFSDYKPVNGIQVNHAFESEHDGKTTRFVLTDVSYDQPLDPALFQLPAGS